MKRIYLLLGFVVFSIVGIQAQGIFDVMRYSNPTFNGSARYMGMGGALGALGGDVSSVLDNPGTLGLYRKSELTFTLDFMPTASTSSWGEVSKATNFNVALNNLSWIHSWVRDRDTEYQGSNIVFTYNRLKNFNQRTAMYGAPSTMSMTDYAAGMTNGLSYSSMNNRNAYFDDAIPYLSVLFFNTWLIDTTTTANQWGSILNPGENATGTYTSIESGRIDEYNFSYGLNIGDYLYLGTGISLQYIDYMRKSIYSESFANGGSFSLTNTYLNNGAGWNFKIGAVVRPASFMRIGFSFQTPTYYSLNESHQGSLDYSEIDGVEKTPTDLTYSTYRYRAPLKFQAGLGFVFGKVASLGVDYVYSDSRNASLGNSRDLINAYSDDNNDIANYTLPVHMLKAGTEFRISPSMMLRGGFAYSTPLMSAETQKFVPMNTTRTDMEYFIDRGSIYGTCGLGFRKRIFGFDIAYVYRQDLQTFMPYETGSKNDAAQVKTAYHNIVTTFSFKF